MLQILIKRSLTVAALGFVFAFLMADFSASTRAGASFDEQDQNGNPPAEQTVEQKYKNIQVLKGMPVSQMRPMMSYISASLGTTCGACHVKNGDNWEFDKDDKKAKQTARKMIQMTMDINKNFFQGKLEVSCQTCHQGQDHPAGVPPLPRVMPKEEPKSNEPWPTPQQILAKYTQAVGGKEAIEKIKTSWLKGTSVAANGQSFPLEIHYASPDKLSLNVSLPQGATTQKLNGQSGWLKNAREDRAMDNVEVVRAKDLAWSLEPLQLKEPYPRLTFGGVEKIGDRACDILRMTLPDKRRVRFYFDKESGLLVRRIVLTETPIGLDPEQTDYEDYREVDGVKLPFTIRTSYLDTFSSSTRKFAEVKSNAQIESAQFNLPAAKQ